MTIGRTIKNIARPKPITAEHASAIADRTINSTSFSSDYDQLKKRFSHRGTLLINGAPPPVVE